MRDPDSLGVRRLLARRGVGLEADVIRAQRRHSIEQRASISDSGDKKQEERTHRTTHTRPAVSQSTGRTIDYIELKDSD